MLFKLIFSEVLEAGDAVVGFYYVSFEIYLATDQIGMVDKVEGVADVSFGKLYRKAL